VSTADITRVAELKALERQDVDLAYETWNASVAARNRATDNYAKASKNLKGAEGHLALILSEYVMEKKKYDEINVKHQGYSIYLDKQKQKVEQYNKVSKDLNMTAQKYEDRYEAKVAVEEDRVSSKKRAAQDRVDKAQERLDAEKSRLSAIEAQVQEARGAIGAAKADIAKAKHEMDAATGKAQAEDVNAGKAEGDAKDAAEGEKGAKQTLKDNQKTLMETPIFLQVSEDPLLREEHAVEAAGGLDSQLKMLDDMKNPKKQQAATKDPMVDEVRKNADEVDDASTDSIKKKAQSRLASLKRDQSLQSEVSAKERLTEAQSDLESGQVDLDQALARKKAVVKEVQRLEGEVKKAQVDSAEVLALKYVPSKVAQFFEKNMKDAQGRAQKNGR
jgi:chromosome segregation ATPase